MGTRHVIGVVHKGEIKVAQYGQWDGYPEGQGVDVASFIQRMDLETFRKAISECVWSTNEDWKKSWTDCGADPNKDTVSMAIADLHSERFPEFSRDTGAKILSLILDKGVRKLRDSHEFCGESLFCEWAYILDLDREVLEVYKGFNKNKDLAAPRFKHLPEDDGYFPVRLLAEIPFKDVTPKAVVALDKDEEDDVA